MFLNSRTKRRATGIALVAAICGYGSAQTLNDIKSKTGAEIVYGPLEGYDNLQDGLVYILKQVHGHYGSKPDLGGFFKAKTGESVGAFFDIDDKNFSHEKQSGLVLVTKQNGSVEVAVLTDKVSQFKGSINGMLKKVQEAWYGGGNSDGGSASDPVQPLETYSFPDGSGTLQMAAGWRPLAARAGGILAMGPNGETLEASCYLGVLDANLPRVRQKLASGGLPGNYAASPSGAKPEDAFGYLYNQFRQKHGLLPGKVHVSVVKSGQDSLGTTFILAGDFEDARTGAQNIVAAMSAGSVNPRTGGWSCILTSVTAPKQIFGKERLTLLAMANSLHPNDAVIRKEGDEASQAIIKYGESVRKTTAEKNDAFSDYMKSIDTLHDNQAKHSAAFQDLQLDQSVVEHTASGYHGRLYNDDANLLVASNPDKWQIVQGSNYVKGKDY